MGAGSARTQQALPVIRPVNHLVDGGGVIIRIHAESALLHNTAVTGVMVFEADQLDPTDGYWLECRRTTELALARFP
ncbi:hypothetical protein ABIE67_009894 [Streptomyces sp. V4I8]